MKRLLLAVAVFAFAQASCLAQNVLVNTTDAVEVADAAGVPREVEYTDKNGVDQKVSLRGAHMGEISPDGGLTSYRVWMFDKEGGWLRLIPLGGKYSKGQIIRISTSLAIRGRHMLNPPQGTPLGEEPVEFWLMGPF